MQIDPEQFRVREGKKVHLKDWCTHVGPFYKSKSDYKDLLAEHIEAMGELQELLYAHNRYALLVIFQAMDAAGKDSAIKHVMRGLDPKATQVFTFKAPSDEETKANPRARSAKLRAAVRTDAPAWREAA